MTIAPSQPIGIPSGLQFAQERYTVRPKKLKGITLQAPAHLVERHGTSVSLRVSSTELTIKKPTLMLKLRPDKLFYEAATTLSGTKIGVKAKLVAECANLVAVARIAIADQEEDQPTISIVPVPIGSPQRAQVDVQPDRSIVIKINTTHSAIKRYLGAHPAYPLQHTPLARVMMGEVAGKEIVQYLLKQFYEGKTVSTDMLDWKRVHEESALMHRVHTVMLSDEEVRIIQRAASAPESSRTDVA